MNYKNKSKLVKKVFNTVVDYYDIMNDIISFGVHRIWKNKMINSINFAKNSNFLDVAGGTGDIAIRIAKKSPNSKITVFDINENMLKIGRDKAINLNYLNLNWVHGNVENLPFKNYEFDCCTISFGIRNFSNRNLALSEVYRILKKNGQFICLEFAPMHYQNKFFIKLYNFYSFNIIPNIGKIIAKDYNSYEYLVKSIKKFPLQSKFKTEIEKVGFKNVKFYNMSYGIVALYIGTK